MMSREVQLALGRIFRLGSRPFRSGDLEEYEKARAVVLAHTSSESEVYRPDWARDRSKGAPGD